MKISIRNKLTALILTICLSGVMIIWIGTIAFFKPMYYAMTQAEISSMLSKTIKTLSQADGELTDDTVDKIKSYINGSFCIEIADEFGNRTCAYGGHRRRLPASRRGTGDSKG